jgi:multidrug efflux pump subunit AcrA (membrane-fusion protein)
MTVETTCAHKQSISEEITVVGNLIGDATVSVAPRAAGRLQDVVVRLGDRVGMGQRLAKIEDFEIVEQVKQAEAGTGVSLATIRQREADLKLAETSAERSRNLYQRQLLPKQTLDDNEAKYQAASRTARPGAGAELTVEARLDELKINLANTVIQSPVNGFRVEAARRPWFVRQPERRDRRGGRHHPRASGRQCHREGPEAAAARRPDERAGRCVSREEFKGTIRAGVTRARIRRPERRRSKSRSPIGIIA